MYGLPMFQIILCFVAFILHIIAISSSYWTNFYARNEFGLIYESGHLGLWSVCFNEPGFGNYGRPGNFGGYGREICESVDTMYRQPPFLTFAGVLAVIAALTLLMYFPFAIMRQKYINSPYTSKNSIARYSGAFKLSIATIAAILVVLVLVFVSLRDQEMGIRDFVPIINFRGYYITKSWSFYVESIVALILLILALISLMDNNRSNDMDSMNNGNRFQPPYNIPQAEQIGQQTKAQSTTLPRRTRNEYVDSPNNLRLPHSSQSQNSISGKPDDHINADEDIDQIDEDTANPLNDDLSRLNPHIRRSSRYPTNTSKLATTQKTIPLSITTNAQPFSYHLSPKISPTSKSPTTSLNRLNRNLTKSSTDIRSNRSSSSPRYIERRNSSERIDRIKSPTLINTYKSSPSQRAYYESSSPFSPISNYESNNEPLLGSPLLPSKSNQQLTTSDSQFITNGNQSKRFRTRIISTETTTETTSSTTLKRPQENLLTNSKNASDLNQSTGTIRYHNIDLEPIDRHN